MLYGNVNSGNLAGVLNTTEETLSSCYYIDPASVTTFILRIGPLTIYGPDTKERIDNLDYCTIQCLNVQAETKSVMVQDVSRLKIRSCKMAILLIMKVGCCLLLQYLQLQVGQCQLWPG